MPTINWYKNCPRCHEEGELTIVRRLDTQAIVFRCDECSWMCDRAECVDRYEDGYEGIDIPYVYLSKDEIDAAGWGQYHLRTDHVTN